MYIPAWLIVFGVIVIYWILKKSKVETVNKPDRLEDIEAKVDFFKDSLFGLEYFTSPHFIDVQNDYSIMEINYLRLKERYAHTPEKLIELAQDWLKYVLALRDLKQAGLLLDVDFLDNACENFDENIKQPTIIKEEVEKRFKTLLDKDWQKLLPNYFERLDKAKPEIKKKEESLNASSNTWKMLYFGDANLKKMEKLEKEEKEAQKIKSN